MFTGIITDVATVVSSEPSPAGRRMVIASAYDPDGIDIGASICCSGACMTVVEKGRDAAGRGWFAIDVSPESLKRTTLGTWQAGRRVNLERSLAMGMELGGHLVTGHVDAVARVAERTDEGGTARFVFSVPHELARFIAGKGSVALDGTSLTVNDVDGVTFTVTLIPHTLEVTTWGEKRAGDEVNLEVDLMARYAARLMEFDTPPGARGA
ncbi:MAG: riboflavin synthase [Rhodobiaceae bacterium]|nr:riboflavin synthase [Rhodobiaceae bacterium]MCC0041611.1 riboflavin synthase [Rhodobiaceae bacterium]MCC0052640.1 riboflavin synthase [Rhodobiaceae bacterium]